MDYGRSLDKYTPGGQRKSKRERSPYYWSLKDGPCTDCGGRFPRECMDFDHVPGRGPKEFAIGDRWYLSEEELAPELAKCDLVCANCHRIRTVARLRQSIEQIEKELGGHGTLESGLTYGEAVALAVLRGAK